MVAYVPAPVVADLAVVAADPFPVATNPVAPVATNPVAPVATNPVAPVVLAAAAVADSVPVDFCVFPDLM